MKTKSSFSIFLFFLLLCVITPILIIIPSQNLNAASLTYEGYAYQQVAPNTSYTKSFTVSSAPSNAILTNVEVQFTYIAYGVVQNYLSARVNKGSNPGSSGGAVLVSQGSLPSGNPGTYGYKSFSNWNGQGVNKSPLCKHEQE